MVRHPRAVLALGLGAASATAAAIAAWLIRPWVAVQVGFDSAASVIHFQRLVGGRHLEAFVTTTPKPLLTVVFGMLHWLGSWTLMSWAAILVFGLLAAAAALLAWRVAGPAAGAFVALGLGMSGGLLVETGYVYGVPWAALLWCLAGLAATRSPPRYGLAGVALLLAALIRVETLVLVAFIGIVLVAASVRGRVQRHGLVPKDAWRLLLATAALPVMLVHDWLLTGNSLFWLTVSTRYTEAAEVRVAILGPLEVATWIAGRYVHQPVLIALAIAGAIAVVRRRQWPVAVGLAGIGPGIALFLVVLAARGTYVSPRYIVPVDAAAVFAAGIGIDALLEAALAIVGQRPSGWGRPALAALVVVIALAIVSPPWGASFRFAANTIARERILNGNAAFVEPTIDAELDAIPGSRDAPPSGAGVDGPRTREPLLLVPSPLRPRLAVDLELPLDRIAGLELQQMEEPQVTFVPGRIVYVDERGGHSGDAFAALRIDVEATLGPVRLIPVLADARRKAWVLRIEPGTP